MLLQKRLEKIDYKKLLERSSDCTEEILEAKKNYIIKMTTKHQNPKATAKMYWQF